MLTNVPSVLIENKYFLDSGILSYSSKLFNARFCAQYKTEQETLKEIFAPNPMSVFLEVGGELVLPLHNIVKVVGLQPKIQSRFMLGYSSLIFNDFYEVAVKDCVLNFKKSVI